MSTTDDDATEFIKMLVHLGFLEYGIDSKTKIDGVRLTDQGEKLFKFLQYVKDAV